MAVFKIKEVEQARMAYIYEVEAETSEEAVKKYEEELAGSLTPEDCFIVFDLEDSVTAYQE